jgi:hypothetical protein
MKRNLIKLLLTAAVPWAALCLAPLVHAEGASGSVYYLQSVGGVGSAPLPFDPCGSSVPVVQVSPGVYLVEDGSGSQTMAAGVQAEDAGLPPLPGGDGGTTNSSPISDGVGQPINYTNGLWIGLTNQGGGNLGFTLHNTTNGDNYQLLSTTNLANDSWDLGQIIIGASAGETAFSSLVSITNGTAMFFRAHHAYPVIEIEATQSAVEPTNAVSGQDGFFRVYDEATPTNNVTVYYGISGTATNGTDYAAIGTAITIPADSGYAYIQIVPSDVGITPDKSIVLTLVQNTNYLIDPSYYYASNVLTANPELYPYAYGDNEHFCPNSWGGFYVNVDDPSGLPLSYTVVTNVMHGTVSIDSSGWVTYTPAASFEGIDSFAYTATSGDYSSAPAVVTLYVSDPVTANAVQVQTCSGTPVTVSLSGGDSCNESLTYIIVVNPAHGQITGLSGNACVYTPTGTNFTGTDSFMYLVTASTGDWATNVVTVTVGDTGITANTQNVLTSTNIPVVIALNAGDSDGCVESNRWTSSVTSGPAHGTLTGSGLDLTYTPNRNFEGTDSFQYTASDGVWTSSPATVTIYVVGAPYLSGQCDLFGGSAALEWTEDSTTTALLQNGLGNTVFVVGRSTNPNGPFSLIATNPTSGAWAYWDNSASPGQTYYYVVALDFTDGYSGLTYQSAFSNTNRQTAQSADLIAPNSLWYVTDWNELSPANINTNVPVFTIYTNPPNMVAPVFTNWVTGPFSDPANYAARYNATFPDLPPLPPITVNTNPVWAWTNAHTIWAHCTLNLTGYTPQQLSNVVYSTAIDNGYMLFINSTNVNQNPSEVYSNTWASWGMQSQSGQLFSPLPNLVAGTNTVDVIFWGDNDNADYFSMVVTTNTCGQ